MTSEEASKPIYVVGQRLWLKPAYHGSGYEIVISKVGRSWVTFDRADSERSLSRRNIREAFAKAQADYERAKGRR